MAGDKSEAVRRMFDRIAPTYDRLNHCLSCHIDKYWRRRALLPLRAAHPQRMLDVATGTGDFAILAARMLKPEHITGADISEEMMGIGREKADKAQLGGVICFEKEDCMNLSYSDNSFDAVISAFGIRNFRDLDRGLSEICRVLRKGGMFSAVEMATPVHFPVKQLFSFYSEKFIPLCGQFISGDRAAYEYLNKSIEAFKQGEQMRRILLKAGFKEVKFKRMTFGICTRYMAVK